jgi:hypothetical protein
MQSRLAPEGSARNEAIFTEIRPKLPYGRVAREPFAKGNARYDLELGWPQGFS